MNNKAKKERHILALSGGKDSAALAVYLTTVKPIPNLEFVFCDTRHELPETYEFLKKIEAKLGIEVTVLQPKRDFEFWLDIFKGCLPSPSNRWCTRQLKIIPYEEFIGNDIAYSYIGLRADEDRDGYISSKLNIRPRYPFKVDGIEYSDVANLLKMSDLGFPDYYQWRSRSGCYFCFFQRKHEWIKLYDHHPELFQKAVNFESNHLDQRNYTWVENEPLRKLLKKRKKIIIEAKLRQKKKVKKESRLTTKFNCMNFSLGKESIFKNTNTDNESCSSAPDDEACLICTL